MASVGMMGDYARGVYTLLNDEGHREDVPRAQEESLDVERIRKEMETYSQPR